MKKVKKIKKIPKYFDGTQSIAAIKDPIKTKANESGNAALSAPLKQPDALTKHNAQQMSNALNKNYGITPMQNVPEFMGLSINNTMLGAAASVAEPVAQAFGIEQGKAGQTIGAIGKAVGMVNPAIGAALQIAGATAGGRATLDRSKISSTSNINDAVSHNTGWIGGLMGADRDALLAQASGIQNSKMAAEQTANKQLEWANDPTNQGMVSTLKEGGVIIGDPSKGLTRVQVDSREVITDKNGNNAVRLPYAEGTDSIPALIQPTYKVFSADRGYADIAEKITKGTKEGSRLRQIETNNLAIIQEMTKLKKPTNSKILHASGGDIVPYSYDKNLSNFKYWDVKNNDYTKDYLDWVNTITDQDVKDIYSGKYGNMNTYLGKNKNYTPTVEEARKLMTDKKYGDWHKIAQIVYDKKNSGPETPKKLSALDMIKFAATPGSLSADSARNLKITTPGMRLHKSKSKLNISSDLGAIADYTPLLAAYLNDPEFHVETPETWTPEFAPVAVSIEAQRRAIDDSMAMARYNQANISPNTGAGMAYGLQSASNRAKQLADVYTYQTNAQNELIGRNVDRYNQWAPSMATARYQAIADTRANEAAADAQRDVRIKDAMSYLRDQQMLPFLKQYLSSGAYDKSIKKLS